MGGGLIAQTLLDLLPQFPAHYRLVLPWMAYLLVTNFAQVNRVRQQLVQSAARKLPASRAHAVYRHPDFGDDLATLQIAFKEPDGTEFEISLIDVFHRRGFGPIDYQPAIADLVAERWHPAHPHSLALGGGDLVTDPLAGYLALELREGQQDVKCKASHRGSSVELLRDCDKRNALRVEQLDHLGEVGDRTGKAIDLVNDYHIYDSPPDIFQQALKGGALHRSARKAAIIVSGLDEPPALTRLALDERLARFALRVQRVEVLLKAFF